MRSNCSRGLRHWLIWGGRGFTVRHWDEEVSEIYILIKKIRRYYMGYNMYDIRVYIQWNNAHSTQKPGVKRHW